MPEGVDPEREAQARRERAKDVRDGWRDQPTRTFKPQTDLTKVPGTAAFTLRSLYPKLMYEVDDLEALKKIFLDTLSVFVDKGGVGEGRLRWYKLTVGGIDTVEEMRRMINNFILKASGEGVIRSSREMELSPELTLLVEFLVLEDKSLWLEAVYNPEEMQLHGPEGKPRVDITTRPGNPAEEMTRRYQELMAIDDLESLRKEALMIIAKYAGHGLGAENARKATAIVNGITNVDKLKMYITNAFVLKPSLGPAELVGRRVRREELTKEQQQILEMVGQYYDLSSLLEENVKDARTEGVVERWVRYMRASDRSIYDVQEDKVWFELPPGVMLTEADREPLRKYLNEGDGELRNAIIETLKKSIPSVGTAVSVEVIPPRTVIVAWTADHD